MAVLGLVGVAGGPQWQGRLSGEAQRAVSLDGELGRVAAELLVMLDDVGVGRGDAAGVVYVIVLDVCLRHLAGGTWGAGDGLVVVGDVCLVVDQVGVLPLDDVWLGVPLRLLPHRHVITVRRDVIWVVKGHVLAPFFLLLLLLLRLLLLLWHFGLVAALAVVAEDQTEHHQGQGCGTASHNGRHCPDGQGKLLGRGARAADEAAIVGRLAESALRALNPQARHQGLAGLASIELRADAGVTRTGTRDAAPSVLARAGGTFAGWKALVGVPLVDAHQTVPAWAAVTQVGPSAADLDGWAGLGDGDSAVISAEGKIFPIVLHIGQAAVEACGKNRERKRCSNNRKHFWMAIKTTQ